MPPYFRSANAFAALSTHADEDQRPSNVEPGAEPRAFERKTPKRRTRRSKPVDEQSVPTPRSRKETFQRPSSKTKQRTPEQESAPVDSEDWMYARERFMDLDKEYGPFTLDAAASVGGDNAQCKAFCSTGDSFLDKRLDAETIWANFPYGRAEEFLSHYEAEKARDPRNAGMFVLPKWRGASWWSKVERMQLVKEHSKGEQLFTAPPTGRSKERRVLGPAPWPVCVFWDPPAAEELPPRVSLDDDPRVETGPLLEEEPDDSDQRPHVGLMEHSKEEEQPVADDSPALAKHDDNRNRLLIVRGRIGGQRATILIDGGSQVDLIASRFVEKHRLSTAPSPGKGLRVELAGGQIQDANIVTQPTTIQLSAWTAEQPSLHVTELKEYDVILGKPWLFAHNPQIHWRANVVQLWTKGRPVRVTAKAQSLSRQRQPVATSATAAAAADEPQQPQQQGEQRPDVRMISQAKLARYARQKGVSTFLGVVELVPPPTGDGEANAAQPRRGVGVAHASTGGGETSPCQANGEQSTSRAPDDGGLSQRIEALAAEFPDVFEEMTGMPPERDTVHKIELEDGAQPPSQQLIRLSPLEMEEAHRQITEFCRKAHVRPSKSAYGAPVLFAKKKGGALRMCIDYRRLNKQTRKDRYPMPRADELMDQLLHAKVFTKLDLQSGYHQVRMAPDDIQKTAFRTRFGHFEFTVMPFGLCNAPATFQRMMNGVLATFLDKFVVVYLDDILIFSRSEEEHVEHLRQVLQRLREEKLFCRRHKCTFGAKEVEYLGHMVGNDSVRMCADKLEAVAKWPTPRNKSDIASFLGLAGYYRRFIEHFAERTLPMSELLKQAAEWSWGEEQQQSFQDLKAAMTSEPVLTIADPTLPYEVYTDSSDFGLGAVLLQDKGNGQQPIAYISHKLSPAERNYKTHEQELLGIIHALKTWRYYLEGASFKINSDHKSLQELQSQPKLSRRQARWVEFLQAYDCKVSYVEGERNMADALSRRYDMAQPAAGSTDPAQPSGVHGTSCAQCALLGVKPMGRSAGSASPAGALGTSCARSAELRSSGESHGGSASPAPRADVPGTSCARGAKLGASGERRTVDLMHASTVSEDSSWLELVRQATTADAYPQRDRRLTASDGRYYLGERLYVPPTLRKHVVEELHASSYGGHFGVDKTIDAITRRFFWPHIKRLVRRVVRGCKECQTSRPRHQRAYGLLEPIPVPDRPWQQVTLDLVTDLPRSADGFDAILTFVDRLSKMVHLVPTNKTVGAIGTAHLFKDHVFKHHGLPEVIIGDRDQRWSGHFWDAVFKSLGTKIKLSTAYHPQTDGQSERANRTMEEVLRSYVHPLADDWSRKLGDAEFAYNSSQQRSSGRSPFYVAYGYHPRTPADLYNPRHAEDIPAAHDFVQAALDNHAAARAALKQAQERQREQYDRRKARTPFERGSWVLLEAKKYRFQGGDKHKLNKPWIGPYKIRKMLGPNAANLELPRTVRVHPTINVSRLKAFLGRRGPDGRPLGLEKMRALHAPIVDDQQEEEVDVGQVKEVLAYRDVYDSKRRSQQLRREFLASFIGQPEESNSWLTQEQLRDPKITLRVVRDIARGALRCDAPVYRRR